jgi:hypothetical protein
LTLELCVDRSCNGETHSENDGAYDHPHQNIVAQSAL